MYRRLNRVIVMNLSHSKFNDLNQMRQQFYLEIMHKHCVIMPVSDINQFNK